MPDADSETEGATMPATTYESLRKEAMALVVNVTDGDDGLQSGFYDDIEDGDLVEWRESRRLLGPVSGHRRCHWDGSRPERPGPPVRVLGNGVQRHRECGRDG